jgi:beta-N-acetylhexosaminidase
MKILILILLMVSSPLGFGNVDRLMNELTLDQLIGQMLLVGFRGTQVANNTEILQAIREAHIGSVIYFDFDATTRTRGRNITSPAQLKKLSQDLQDASQIPLFISVDEEGGLVSRLHPRYGFRAKPKPEELARLSRSRARAQMSLLAQELAGHGINLNFAPLADVNVNSKNPVIGALGRSFSADPEVVISLARDFIQEQSKAGITSVLKHFPGHGSSDRDSHLGVVDVTQSWIAPELRPYEVLIREGMVDMIMTAHIYQRNLDRELPATLSRTILTELLRGELGFEGVIISDDMNMKAITDQFGFEEALIRAINAGVDILLLGNNLSWDPLLSIKAHQAIKQAVERGDIERERVEQSARRVLELKSARGVL